MLSSYFFFLNDDCYVYICGFFKTSNEKVTDNLIGTSAWCEGSLLFIECWN